MLLPSPLVEGRLVRRYQRFFADIICINGEEVTAHTPNTGSMLQCATPGARVLLSRSTNPKRKLGWTLELVEVDGRWVDTNTLRANRVVEEALRTQAIPELSDYQTIKPEYPFRDSRIDFFLEGAPGRALVEVKSVTLCCESGVACFPDAVTTRGQKHLRELVGAMHEGWHSVVLFLVRRSEAIAFAPAERIDPEYARLLRWAAAEGVEVLAYQGLAEGGRVALGRRLPIQL